MKTHLIIFTSIVVFSNPGFAHLVAEAQVGGSETIYDEGSTDVDEYDYAEDPEDDVFALAVTSNGFAGARSSAGFGWLRGVSNGEAQSGGNFRLQYNVESLSRWADVFTLTTTDPLLIGTSGTLRVGVETHGGLEVNVGLFGGASAAASVNLHYGGDTESRYQERTWSGGPQFSGDSSMNMTVDIPFVWNTPFDVALELRTFVSVVGAEGTPGSIGLATSDYSNTSEWQGFLGVFDTNNNFVSDYSFSSESGVDYQSAIEAPPVPEPSALILLSLAAAFGTLNHRRRQQ